MGFDCVVSIGRGPLYLYRGEGWSYPSRIPYGTKSRAKQEFQPDSKRTGLTGDPDRSDRSMRAYRPKVALLARVIFGCQHLGPPSEAGTPTDPIDQSKSQLQFVDFRHVIFFFASQLSNSSSHSPFSGRIYGGFRWNLSLI